MPPLDETRLWRAVLVQAFADAGSTGGRAAAQQTRLRAQRWLTTYSRDLFEVCRLAEEDFERVMHIALRFKAAGWPDIIAGQHRTHASPRPFTSRQEHHAAMDIDTAEEKEVPRASRADRQHHVRSAELGA